MTHKPNKAAKSKRSPRRSASASTERPSIAAFARAHGRSKATGSAWKARGYLVLDRAGRVKPAESEQRLRDAGLLPPLPPAPDSPTDSDPALDALSERLARGDLLTWSEAQRVKENYLARLRQVEFEHKSGRLVEVGAVADLYSRELAKVRNRLLAIPTHVGQRATPDAGKAAVADLVHELIIEALEELSSGDAAADHARSASDGT